MPLRMIIGPGFRGHATLAGSAYIESYELPCEFYWFDHGFRVCHLA